MIKAILFDMDGVLIDAKDWHYEALNQSLGLFGFKISRYDHLTIFDGLPTKDKLKLLSLQEGLPSKLHSFINEMKQIYTIDHIHEKCRPIFQHQYALSKLNKQGYKLAVCSNSVRKTIDLMMGKSELIQYLEFFLSNEDVKKSKPDPEIYIKAMARLELQPEECLILEDNQNGVKAAKASGAHVLVIKTVLDVTYENIIEKISHIEGGLHD